MRIALVHDWLNGMRGGEKVLEALIQLYPGSDIFTLFSDPPKLSPLIQSQHITTSPLQHFPGVLRHYRRLLPLFPWAIKHFDLRDYDLVISISHCVAKSALAASPERHFCYCLSPMRYLWSHYDQYSSARQTNAIERLGMRFFQSPLRNWDRQTSSRAGRYVAISQAIARRIQSSYGREAGVVYPPVDTDFFTPAEKPKSDYFLAVSAAVPYKRLDLAVRACSALRRPLKIVGGGPGMDAIRAIAGPTVEVLGWVSNDELRELYQNCTALIFPPKRILASRRLKQMPAENRSLPLPKAGHWKRSWRARRANSSASKRPNLSSNRCAILTLLPTIQRPFGAMRVGLAAPGSHRSFKMKYKDFLMAVLCLWNHPARMYRNMGHPPKNSTI